MDNQLMTSMQVTPSYWQSKSAKNMKEESFKLRERELLKWAGIDLTSKILKNIVTQDLDSTIGNHWAGEVALRLRVLFERLVNA
ncbi:MAG: hypothetical protein Q9161_009347 [Pseudevernia consocians]